MSRIETQRMLEHTFPQTALTLMLDDYDSMIRNLFLRKYNLVLVSAGRMVESLFVCLSNLTSNPVAANPVFNDIHTELENMSEEDLPSSVRVIIPRAAKIVYTFRSKRNAVHVNPAVSPGYMDAVTCVSIAQWILAELVRVFSDEDPGQIVRLVQSLVDRKIPLVEEINGTPIILESDISAHDSILILLYNDYPEAIHKDTLVELLSADHNRSNVITSLRNAEKAKLVYRDGPHNYLTQRGIEFVEEKFGDQFLGSDGKE